MRTKPELSERQTRILDYIKQEIRTRGYPPSVREIGAAVGLKSSSTVHAHLQQLEEKGFLRRDPAKPRAMEVLDGKPDEETHEMIELPVIGKVAAGVPILALENREGSLLLPASFLGQGEHFILTVQGDSMIEAGILEGDFLVVRSQPTAENGEIVVALLEDEATVKRFYRRNGHIELRPENSRLEPIITDRAEIVGKVVGLIRKM